MTRKIIGVQLFLFQPDSTMLYFFSTNHNATNTHACRHTEKHETESAMTENDLTLLRIDKSGTPSRSLKKKRYILIVFMIGLLIGTGFLYQKGFLTPAVAVQTASVQKIYPSQTFTILNASGYVVAQRKAAVAAKITGRLMYLAVEEGSRVKKGDIIARLDNEDALAVRDQALASVQTARFLLEQSLAELTDASLSYNRSKKLVSAGYIAESEFDAADARLKRARAAVQANQSAVSNSQAALKGAEVTLDYANLRAPFDAVVLTKNADIGDIVTPLGAAANAKASVVDVADMDSLKVEVDVSESNIEKVFKDQPCEIYLDALPSERFAGRVHMIVPTADRTKASVMVKVAFDALNPKVLPEMSAKVAFLLREVTESEMQPVTAVPATAIVYRNNRTVAFRISGNRAAGAPVAPGRRMDGLIEILSGLNIGDKVLISPPDNIFEGTKVKLAP
jgi:RND family efflux transporter MFP subunit